MNNKFDDLTKAMAQAVTRRGALKKFGLAAAGAMLTCFGLAKRAEAGARQGARYCSVTTAMSGYVYDGFCANTVVGGFRSCRSCPAAGTPVGNDANIQHVITCGGLCSMFVDLSNKCNC
jgi:hypothetical protein